MQSFAKNLHNPLLEFVGEPIVALLISLGAAIYLLGFNRGISWSDLQAWLLESIKDISP